MYFIHNATARIFKVDPAMHTVEDFVVQCFDLDSPNMPAHALPHSTVLITFPEECLFYLVGGGVAPLKDSKTQIQCDSLTEVIELEEKITKSFIEKKTFCYMQPKLFCKLQFERYQHAACPVRMPKPADHSKLLLYLLVCGGAHPEASRKVELVAISNKKVTNLPDLVEERAYASCLCVQENKCFVFSKDSIEWILIDPWWQHRKTAMKAWQKLSLKIPPLTSATLIPLN